MRLVIVTGMSGAGRATALRLLEDKGYYCVDNLPIPLLTTFAELIYGSGSEITKAAIGMDIRSGGRLSLVEEQLTKMDELGYHYEILFMEASDETLIKRYKETRRSHPVTGKGRIEEGIQKERKSLAFLKNRANFIIDTSKLLVRELNQELEEIFVQNSEFKNMVITVLSFGFKYGIPSDADLVFDVRFLPNPFYVDELKQKTGNDREVQDYVMSTTVAEEFLRKLKEMILFLIPNYVAEGKNQLVIAIGCTGGKHRSVTLANKLFDEVSEQREYRVIKQHRDVLR